MLERMWEDWREVCTRFGADEELLREYDVRPQAARICGGALHVRGVRKELYVKRPTCSSTRLQQVHQLIERVAQSGVRVARFIPTKYGDPFVARPDGLFYAMRAGVGGQPRLERITVFIAALELLARWHQNAITEPGELLAMERLDLPARLMQDMARLEACRQQALRTADAAEMDQLFLSVREGLSSTVQNVLLGLREADFSSLCRTAWSAGAVCHGSFVRQNLLSHDEVLSVLDHDHVYLGPQVLDLAAFLRRYVRLYDWSPDVLAQGIAQYERIRPLTEPEFAILPVLLSYPENVLRVLEWYYEGNSEAPEEEFLDAFEREWAWHEACQSTIEHLYGEQVAKLWGAKDGQGSDVARAEAVLSTDALSPEEAVQDDRVPGLTRFWRSWRRLHNP
ncbi:MAG: phosphotransferase [Firmicutes bacterium]|nr:phosphotransferase [Bacillota bacterium]